MTGVLLTHHSHTVSWTWERVFGSCSVGIDKVSTEQTTGGLCALSITEKRLSHEQEDIGNLR